MEEERVTMWVRHALQQKGEEAGEEYEKEEAALMHRHDHCTPAVYINLEIPLAKQRCATKTR